MAYSGDGGITGRYIYGTATGILPAGLSNAAELFQVKWASTTHKFRLDRFQVTAVAHPTAGAYFAIGTVIVGLFRRKGWTNDGAGGTSFTPNETTTSFKKQSHYPLTQIGAGDMRVATTAALTVGNGTLDTPGLSFVTGACPNAAGDPLIMIPPTEMVHPLTPDDQKLHLVRDEGLVLQNVIVPATGPWRVSVIMEWTEMPV